MSILGILNGIIGIVFAMRLLRINGNLNGYKKPLAYTCLALLFAVAALIALMAARG